MSGTDRMEREAGMEAAPEGESHSTVPLPPLRVSGLVVSKGDLVAALRAYVPSLLDVTPLDGTDGFLLVLPSPLDEGARGPGA